MKRINYSKIDEIKALLASRGWAPQKKFGQNYLIDLGSRELVWKTLDAQPNELIWEIGPGLGVLTHKLADRGEPFWVFELDEGYADFLVESFGREGLNIVRGDFLKTWRAEYERAKPDKILGNLPYNVSSQMILRLVEGVASLPTCVFTLQKELALRLAAQVGQKEYSVFSLLCQWAFDVKLVRVLGAGAFYPRPQVSSAVVLLIPSHRYALADFPAFQKLVKAAFSTRRKMLKNTLSLFLKEKGISEGKARETFKSLGLSLSQRAEELTLDQYVQLTALLR